MNLYRHSAVTLRHGFGLAIPLLLLALLDPVIAKDYPRDGDATRPVAQSASEKSSVAKLSNVGRKAAKLKHLRKSAKAPRMPRSTVSPVKPGAGRHQAIAVHSRTGRRLTVTAPLVARESQAQRADECMQRIERAIQPSRVLKLAEECEKELSPAPSAYEFQRIVAGARQAMEVQRSAGLSADLFDDPEGGAVFHELVSKAGRGDKDAAYQIAQAYKIGQPGIVANSRRMEQWLRFSAELGNGRASWELAEFYNYSGLVADAARFERRAQDLGYRPGVRLPSRGY